MYNTYGTYGYGNYNYNTTAASAAAGVVGVALVFLVIFYILLFAAAVVELIGMWKAFEKMGKKGYEALIPGHNYVVLFEKAGMSLWYFFLMLIPVCNIVFLILVSIEIAKKFGKSSGFGVLLALFGFVCWPILGFGKATFKD